VDNTLNAASSNYATQTIAVQGTGIADAPAVLQTPTPGSTLSGSSLTGLPTNGETIYATLNSMVNGVWKPTYTSGSRKAPPNQRRTRPQQLPSPVVEVSGIRGGSGTLDEHRRKAIRRDTLGVPPRRASGTQS
jgi:hypothetical protein